MQVRIRGILLGLIAACGGVGLAIAMGSSAGAAGPTTTTLGSTTGTPSQNICVASINCTYIPFTGVSNPELQVPFDGTVTSFSLNAGSASGKVKLRVLRPAPGGQFTGVSTSVRDVYVASQQTTVYADGGTDVLLFASKDSSTGGGILDVSVQGHLIDCSAAACN